MLVYANRAQMVKSDRASTYLAFLAPDIVQLILRGNHPSELNATRLIRMTPLPMAWAEQRFARTDFLASD